MNTRSKIMDSKKIPDEHKVDIDIGFSADYFNPNGNNPYVFEPIRPPDDDMSEEVDTPLLEADVGSPEISDPEHEGLDIKLNPFNEAQLDAVTRAIRAEQVRNMPLNQAMTTLRFDAQDLERLTRMTNKWAQSGEPKTYTPKRRRAAPRAFRSKRSKKPWRTPKKAWVPYKTWLRRKRGRR